MQRLRPHQTLHEAGFTGSGRPLSAVEIRRVCVRTKATKIRLDQGSCMGPQSGVQILTNRIRQMLEREPHFAVYETDLARVWPVTDKDRLQKIREFAKDNGWQVKIQNLGVVAIFSKPKPKIIVPAVK